MSENMLQELIERVSEINRAVAQADTKSIWSYHPANPAAADTDIDAVESAIGRRLCPGYRNFLELADGWPGFYHDVNLFTCGDIQSGEKVDNSWELVEVADAGGGGFLRVARDRELPIGSAEFGIDVFLVDLDSDQGAVRWIAGQEIESFPSFMEFLEGMSRYSEETLDELRADPFLGADPW